MTKTPRTGLSAHKRATQKSFDALRRSNASLTRKTSALARDGRLLKREISLRRAAERTVVQARERYQKLFLESQLMQRTLQHVTRQLLTAQEEERKQISRELHDEVVQTLIGINVQLSALSKGASQGHYDLKEKIAATQRLVENSVKAVHRFARALRPAVLDDLGLIPALHAFCKSLAERKKLVVRITAFRGVEDIGGEKRTILYRVAQEALTNVIRHADATEVDLEIRSAAPGIRMQITDNGKSFPITKTLLDHNNKRLGLIGMKERVEMVGGTLLIESVAPHGTSVSALIPFHPRKNLK